jgi:heptosyltransferase-2
LENYLEIARRLRQDHYSVRIACDEDQLAWWHSHGENVVCPATVTELMQCLDRVAVFIGNDSGPGHLAASAGVPTFTVFGPSLSEWFAALHPAAEWIDGKACPYKPCSDYCRYPAPYCIWKVTVEEVWGRVRPFLAKHLPASTI